MNAQEIQAATDFKVLYADNIAMGDICGDDINNWCRAKESVYPLANMKDVARNIFYSLDIV